MCHSSISYMDESVLEDIRMVDILNTHGIAHTIRIATQNSCTALHRSSLSLELIYLEGKDV